MAGKYLSLFLIGGAAYLLIECLWRGRTHWSMGVTGGAAFALLYLLFTHMGTGRLALKCLLGSLMITCLEFISGAIFNVALGLRVWDYSGRRFHVYGQVCLLYSVLWCGLCLPIALLVQFIQSAWG